MLACLAAGALSSIAIARSSGSAASAAYYYYCPGGSAGSNYGYCPPTTTTTTTTSTTTTTTSTTTTSTTTTTTTPPPPVPGFMTGGGQFDPLGACPKASFGGNARGVQGGDAKGHFNYVNHCTGVHVNGPVTAILLVDPVTRTMTFEVQDKNNASCTAIVTWRDGGEPGTTDSIDVKFSGADCPPDQTTTAVLLDRGNIQWHSNVRSGTQASGAAAGVFPKGSTFQKLGLQTSTLGFGAVVFGDGSALGQLQVQFAGTTSSGQVRLVSLEGTVTRGSLGTKGSVTLYGTAVLRVDGAPAATLPFKVVATATSVGLTIGDVELKRQSLTAGSVFVGSSEAAFGPA